jgi:TonB family protein
MKYWRKLAAGTVLTMLAALPSPLFAQHPHSAANPGSATTTDPSPAAPRITTTKSGTLPTKDGLRLRLDTDLGDVRILTDASGHVSYRVIAEAGARDPGAEKFLHEFSLAAQKTPAGIALQGHVPWRTFRGRLWVIYEIHVPRRYNLDINTQAGNIVVQQIDGHITLITGGGNIAVDGVGDAEPTTHSPSGPAAQTVANLESKGGHITVGDVDGGLQVTTAGGHITVGNIDGAAQLRTGGGHIRTGRIAGVATLDTGGGNIQVLSAASNVTASTVGGQIDFEEAAGTIHASTGGGAVRIERVSGPTTVQTSGGGVFLRQVEGPLHVSAASGSITAWFTDDSALEMPLIVAGGTRKMRGATELMSDGGDIIVYLARELAITIDAEIEQGGTHRIVADPSLPLKVSYPESGSGVRAVRGKCSMNGGGEILQLKAVSGNILLRLGKPGPKESETSSSAGMVVSAEPRATASEKSADQADGNDHGGGFIEELRRKIQASWWGGVPIDPVKLQKNLVYSVTPVYPEVARKAGVEGDVVLRASVSSKGLVTELKVLSGPPVLARAAVDAVKQWRYHPVMINGRPTDVVATLTVAFRLQ